MFGLDYKTLASFGDLIDLNTCEQWYLYDFGKDLPAEEKQFWGENTGLPFTNPAGNGMIGNPGNILTSPCKDINKTVPYFKEFSREDTNLKTMNNYLYNSIELLSNTHIEFNTKDFEYEQLSVVPDGAITINEVNN